MSFFREHELCALLRWFSNAANRKKSEKIKLHENIIENKNFNSQFTGFVEQFKNANNRANYAKVKIGMTFNFVGLTKPQKRAARVIWVLPN